MKGLFTEQPKAFSLIFMLEFWERFGFYTVNAILAFYFVHQIGLSEEASFYTFGAYSSLVFGLVSLGGYIGDKVLGTKRTLFLGLVVLCLGYLALALLSETGIFFALGVIAVGNGLFKANPSSLLAKCYKTNDSRLHGAFTLYYMAINIGSVIAMLLAPFVMEHYGWNAAFFISFIGLFSAIINYLYQRNRIAQLSTGADAKPLCFKRLYTVLLGVILLSFLCAYLLQHILITQLLLIIVIVMVCLLFFHYLKKESGLVRAKMWVAFILMLEGIVFFTLYQQMPTSLNFFAIHHVRPYLFGFYINPQSFQVFNPLWIMLLSPFLAVWYKKQHEKGQDMSVAHKFALGMTLCGLSFISLYFTQFFANEAYQVSSAWLILSYFFQSLGELFISALGVAMVAQLVPEAISGFIMGMWFLTSASAGFIGAFVASMTKAPSGLSIGYETLTLYADVFLIIGIVTCFFACVMWVLAPRLSLIIRADIKT